jgi:hypothetical protein
LRAFAVIHSRDDQAIDSIRFVTYGEIHLPRKRVWYSLIAHLTTVIDGDLCG